MFIIRLRPCCAYWSTSNPISIVGTVRKAAYAVVFNSFTGKSPDALTDAGQLGLHLMPVTPKVISEQKC